MLNSSVKNDAQLVLWDLNYRGNKLLRDWENVIKSILFSSQCCINRLAQIWGSSPDCYSLHLTHTQLHESTAIFDILKEKGVDMCPLREAETTEI